MVQENRMKQKIIVVCGPTASGKTALAVNLAKELASEVISADSMCIYKGFDVGTAKPTKEERGAIPHHMIDVCDGRETFSVADYKRIAEPIVKDLLGKGKTPIVCGGTGFYIESLLFDFSYGNACKNDAVREKYERFLEENGKEALFAVLREKDEKSAEKLHQNDVKRVIRALEIFDCGGKAKSEYEEKRLPKYDYIAVSFDFPREELYRRIDLRAEEMFDNGLVEEVKSLVVSGLDETCQSMQGIGYKEVLSYLRGEIDLREAKALVAMNSRRYAKRQITFFKRWENLRYICPQKETNAVREVLKLL